MYEFLIKIVFVNSMFYNMVFNPSPLTGKRDQFKSQMDL